MAVFATFRQKRNELKVKSKRQIKRCHVELVETYSIHFDIPIAIGISVTKRVKSEGQAQLRMEDRNRHFDRLSVTKGVKSEKIKVKSKEQIKTEIASFLAIVEVT